MPFAGPNTLSTEPLEGGIEIDEAQYQAGLEALAAGLHISIENGFAIVDPPPPAEAPPPPPPTLEQRRDQRRDEVRARRWAVEMGGVEIAPGVIVRTDEGSQAKITGAVQLFAADPTLEAIDWEAQPGVWTTIDRETMTAIGIAVGRHVQAAFSRSRALHEAIAAAPDIETLEAIDIETGWP